MRQHAEVAIWCPSLYFVKGQNVRLTLNLRCSCTLDPFVLKIMQLCLSGDPGLSKLGPFWKELKLNGCWFDFDTTRVIEIKANQYADWSELSQSFCSFDRLNYRIQGHLFASPAFFAIQQKRSRLSILLLVIFAAERSRWLRLQIRLQLGRF